MTDRWNQYSLQGCLFEKTPVAAPMLTAPTGSVPEHVDLRPLCSPVEDQLTTNSCTANAIVGALEYHQRRAKMKTTDMSRLFVYYNARKISDTEGEDSGSFIHHVMASVLAHGACEERMWPFEQAMVLTKPTKAAFKDAMKHEAIQYARTELGQSAMAAVAAGLPVVFGTYIPGEYFHEAARTGIMPVDEGRSQQPDGGHAMLIVGYDISEKYWLVRNSWGADWADGGYFRIPFATMQSYSVPSHFWTIGSIEKTSGFGLTGPSMSQMQSSLLAQAPAQTQAETPSMRETLREELNAGLDDAKKGFRSRLRDD